MERMWIKMDLNTIKEIADIVISVLGTFTITIISIVVFMMAITTIKDIKERAKRDAESDRLFREAIKKLEQDTEKLIENAEKEAKKKKKKEISE